MKRVTVYSPVSSLLLWLEMTREMTNDQEKQQVCMVSKHYNDIPSYTALKPCDPIVSSDCKWSHIWLLMLTIKSGTLDPVRLE